MRLIVTPRDIQELYMLGFFWGVSTAGLYYIYISNYVYISNMQIIYVCVCIYVSHNVEASPGFTRMKMKIIRFSSPPKEVHVISKSNCNQVYHY